LALVGWGAYTGHGTLKAHALRDRLLDANINEVPTIVQEMASYRHWLDPLLHDAYAQAEKDEDRPKQLCLSLALLPVDASQVRYLHGRLLDAKAVEVAVIRDLLLPYRDQLVHELWTVVESPVRGKEAQRLRAAAALAAYDPESEKWTKAQEAIGNDLVAVPAEYLGSWMEALRSVRTKLVPQLSVVYRDASRRETERSLAADILAAFAADDPQVLADLLTDADEKQFTVIYPKLKEHGRESGLLLTSEIDKKPPPGVTASDEKREKLAKRQANAAVALLRMNQADKVWPLLRRSDQPDDPRLRSYLIHRLSPLGADAAAIVKRLDEEPDMTIRRALVLSLGEYSEYKRSPESRKTLLQKLQTLYRSEADPGLHAAVEWLLRQWKEEPWLRQVNDEWAKDKEQRDKRLQDIQQSLRREKEKTPPQWYVNCQGQTMVVIPGPVEFLMGSPHTAADRGGDEQQHKKRIGRTFALAAAPVTKEQFLRFQPGFSHDEIKRYPAPSCPIGGVTWFEAAAYCNWLSDQEGLDEEQWCYESKNRQVTKLKANYLSLTGYRLPTEAEMEYATRAGAVTGRYYGETEELLPKYAWYFKNSQEKTWPVGSLKPNDWGLFDVQGNVFTWCQERYKSYPQSKARAIEDKEDINIIEDRVLRGGSFNYPASFARSSTRIFNTPANGYHIIGFRLARTYR
jgi:formylglycine-generating enzyme required for sulfatase activity